VNPPVAFFGKVAQRRDTGVIQRRLDGELDIIRFVKEPGHVNIEPADPTSSLHRAPE
jgi:hypothetical protein